MTQARSILLVEDEPLIAMMLEDVLDTLGHSVIASVDNVAGALEKVAEGGFDLAILDVNLRGGEPSWPVADACRAKGVPILLASGGGSEPPPEAHRSAPSLAKPFTIADVERAIGAI